METKRVNEIMEDITEDTSLCIIRDALTQYNEPMKNRICCNKPMKEIDIFSSNMTAEQEDFNICLECGLIYDARLLRYDDEELLSLLENENLKDIDLYYKTFYEGLYSDLIGEIERYKYSCEKCVDSSTLEKIEDEYHIELTSFYGEVETEQDIIKLLKFMYNQLEK